MLCPSWDESKAKKLAAEVELANTEGSEADVPQKYMTANFNDAACG